MHILFSCLFCLPYYQLLRYVQIFDDVIPNVRPPLQVLSAESVKNVLSLMYSCGMYNYSGQFAFKVQGSHSRCRVGFQGAGLALKAQGSHSRCRVRIQHAGFAFNVQGYIQGAGFASKVQCWHSTCRVRIQGPGRVSPHFASCEHKNC